MLNYNDDTIRETGEKYYVEKKRIKKECSQIDPTKLLAYGIRLLSYRSSHSFLSQATAAGREPDILKFAVMLLKLISVWKG